VVVTFPPERVMAAMAPLAEQAPSIASQQPKYESTEAPRGTKASALRRLLGIGT
jgi:hypothetical protein